MVDNKSKYCPECGKIMWHTTLHSAYYEHSVWRCDCGLEIRDGIYKQWKTKVIAVSGGFDPLHIGHLKYIQAARRLGDRLIVILNTDEWLMKKKGYVFMKYEEREAILKELKSVTAVWPQLDCDNTVRLSLEIYKPDAFAKGGDSTWDNVPELQTCIENDIELILGVGGNKIQSSSELVKKVI